MATTDDINRIAACVLDDIERTVFTMTTEGYSQREIGQEIGEKQQQISVILYRCRWKIEKAATEETEGKLRHGVTIAQGSEARWAADVTQREGMRK